MFKVIKSDRPEIKLWQIYHMYGKKTFENVVRSIALLWEIGVAESNGDVTILTGSLEVAVSAHAQYKFGQNNPKRLLRRRAAFKLQCFVIY